MTPTYQIDVCAGAFAVARKFAAQSDVRYYLNGVFVEPGERVTLQASTGYMAIVQEDPSGIAKAAKILRVSAAGVRFLKIGNRVRLSDDGQLVIVNASSLTLYMEPNGGVIDGNFPSLANAVGKIDEYQPGLNSDISWDNLHHLFSLGVGRAGVRFYTRANGAVMFILSSVRSGAGKAFGLVMPVRESFGESLVSNLPREFATRLTAKVAA